MTPVAKCKASYPSALQGWSLPGAGAGYTTVWAPLGPEAPSSRARSPYYRALPHQESMEEGSRARRSPRALPILLGKHRYGERLPARLGAAAEKVARVLAVPRGPTPWSWLAQGDTAARAWPGLWHTGPSSGGSAQSGV